MPANSANIVQIDGSSAVTETSTVNKGGVVRHGGNVASDRNLTSKDIGTIIINSVAITFIMDIDNFSGEAFTTYK